MSPRSVIVTGAASGIGRAIAERLVDDGLSVLGRRPRARRRRARRAVRGGPDHPRGQPRRRRCGARALRAPRRDRPQRRLPARRAGSRVPRGPLGRAAGDPAHEPVPAGQVRAGRRWSAAATGASSSSPRSTGWWPRRSRPATWRPSTASSGSVKTLALEGADNGITATAVCPALRPHAAGREADRRSGAGPRAAGGARARGGDPRAARGQAADRARRGRRAWCASCSGPDGRAFTGAPVTMDLGWTAR